MQWTRIAKLSALLTLALAAVLGFSPVSRFIAAEVRSYRERPTPIVATADETRAILAAVLAKEKFGDVPPPPPPPEPGKPAAPSQPEPPQLLIVEDRSACFTAHEKASDCEHHLELDDVATWPWLNSFAPLKLRRELMLANQEPHEVVLEGLPNTKVGSHAEIMGIFAKGGWWNDFHAKYPGSSGFAATSLPVLSADRKQALVYVGYHCGGLCGVGLLLLLERAGSDWRVVKSEELWVS